MFSKTSVLSLVFILASLFLFLFLQNQIPLWSSDEGRYGEIAREMAESGDFVVPHFNYLAYLDKPILAPLTTAVGFKLFGINNFTTRLPSVVSALLTLMLMIIMTQRLFSSTTAWLAGAILLTSGGFVLLGRFAVIDMQMTFLLSGCLLFFMYGYFEQKPGAFLLAYVFMGLAFLAKGLIAIVLPGFSILLFLLWRGNLKALRNFCLVRGAIIVLITILPWILAITRREPDFPEFFFLKQQFQRFATGHFGRSRPFFFFFLIFPIMSLPWTFFLPSGIRHGLKPGNPSRAKIQFLLCWIVAFLIFFSIPRSKLPYYIFPLSVPLAMIIANLLRTWLAHELPEKAGAFLHGLFASIAILLIATGCGLGLVSLILQHPSVQLVKIPLLVLSGCALLGGALLFKISKKKQALPAIAALTTTLYVSLVFVFVSMLLLSPKQSTYAFAQALDPIINKDDLIAVYGSPDKFSDLPFYLKRRIIVVGGDRGTLTYKSMALGDSPQILDWFLTRDAFSERFNQRAATVYCLLEKENLMELQDAGILDYQVVLDLHDRLLISNEVSA